MSRRPTLGEQHGVFVPSTLWVVLLVLLTQASFSLAQSADSNSEANSKANALSAEEKQQGWRLLFDGNSISPWRGYRADDNDSDTGWASKWSIEDQALKLNGSGGSYFQLVLAYLLGRPSADLIYAVEKFSEFELSIDWKISANGNSGIFYLVADEQHTYPWETGPEMQVLDNNGHADGKIQSHRAGDLYDLETSRVEPVKNVGEWNTARIKVHNGFIEHFLNNKSLLRVSYNDDAWRQRVANSKFASMNDFGRADTGYIVLQDHGDTVWYRNIKIRDLSSTPSTMK